MKINDFIELSLRDVKKAVDSFNEQSDSIKVEMPPVLELDLAVHDTPDGVEVAHWPNTSSKEISRLKLTINTLNYPWLKE